MITPSKITSQALRAWVPTYFAMMVHGSSIVTRSEFIEFFVVYPLFSGAGLAVYTFFRDFEADQFLEQVGMNTTNNMLIAISIYYVLPISFVFSTMLYAQMQDSYENTGWVAIVFGGLIIEQLATKIREIVRAKSED